MSDSALSEWEQGWNAALDAVENDLPGLDLRSYRRPFAEDPPLSPAAMKEPDLESGG